MGEVAITFKIMPKSVDIDIYKIKEEISKKIKIHDYHIEDIAFGLKVLRILVVSPDGATEKIENEIKSVEGVSEVEVESSTLI
jgi:translation elongation factor aEF-1 beta